MPAPLHPLWSVFLQTRTVDARNQVYSLYAHLPRLVAQTVGVSRDNQLVNVDECEQFGAMGLLRGIEQYDPDPAKTKGGKPETFLKWKIYSAIKDGHRTLDYVKRDDRALLNKIAKAEAEMRSVGVEPDDAMLAEAVGITDEQMRTLRRGERYANASAMSVFEKGGEDESYEGTDKQALPPHERAAVADRVKDQLRRSLGRFKTEEQIAALVLFHLEGASLRDVYAFLKGRRDSDTRKGVPDWVRRLLANPV